MNSNSIFNLYSRTDLGFINTNHLKDANTQEQIDMTRYLKYVCILIMGLFSYIVHTWLQKIYYMQCCANIFQVLFFKNSQFCTVIHSILSIVEGNFSDIMYSIMVLLKKD